MQMTTRIGQIHQPTMFILLLLLLFNDVYFVTSDEEVCKNNLIEEIGKLNPNALSREQVYADWHRNITVDLPGFKVLSLSLSHSISIYISTRTIVL